MSTATNSRSYSRRTAGTLLLVGVLAGVTIGGGAGVIAASSTKSVTVCVDKIDKHMNYSKSGVCKSHQIKMVLNQTGAAGAKGDTGAAGAKGDTGAAGTNATLAITQQLVCDGSDAGAVADELCKIGMTGPGGGIVFFVDYNNQYTGLDYLEAAPVGWGNAIAVNEGGLAGETTGSSAQDPLMKWCSNTSSFLGLYAWSNSAVGAGANNTSTANTTCAGGAIQAASDYVGGSKSDWFLPSVGEAMLMYNNLRQAGVGGFGPVGYWCSTEADTLYAWDLYFLSGDQLNYGKTALGYVRPVRAF